LVQDDDGFRKVLLLQSAEKKHWVVSMMPEISGPAPFVFSLFNGRQALQLVGSGTMLRVACQGASEEQAAERAPQTPQEHAQHHPHSIHGTRSA
jgi:hypothetical protein